MSSLISLLPDFAIIVFGVFIGSRIPESAWKQIDSLSYYLFYPALLFSAASQRPIDVDALLLIGIMAFAIVTVGLLLALAAGRVSAEETVQNTDGIAQNAWRFNTALGFVAIAVLPGDAIAVLAIAVGIGIPLANLYAVVLLAKQQIRSRWVLAKEVLMNPFLLASLAGVLVGLSGASLPSLVTGFSERLAGAAIPIVLLSLGAALSRARLWPLDSYTITINTIKLVCLPSLVWLIIAIGNFQGVVPATLLIFSALPTASSAHVLASRYGADRGRVAVVVMQSSLAGLITLPFWAAVAASIALK